MHIKKTRSIDLRAVWILVLLLCGPAGCRNNNITEDASFSVMESGEMLVSLKNDAAIVIKQHGGAGGRILVANSGDSLSVIQLQDSQALTPSLSAVFFDSGESRFSVTRKILQGEEKIMDIDADGIPDFKLVYDGNQKQPQRYKLERIIWQPIDESTFP